MKKFLGSDEGVDEETELNSPGGIAVETLLNIRTVAALNLERSLFNKYISAIELSEPKLNFNALLSGLTSGLGVAIQQWSNALLFWWGGYLMAHYPEKYNFEDFLISMFSLLFSLFGLGAAFQSVADKDACMASAGRIFYLMKRKSPIDPMSDEGKKL
jgi:ATP-binding cassette subfamily B (MDR/TAP) protein 1